MTSIAPKVEIKLSGTWTDITSYVYYRDSISITRGKTDEASVIEPGNCSFTLNNRDGRFSPRNPTGPYYGLIGRNTPVRVSQPGSGSYVSMPGPIDETYSISTPDNAALDITGDIDVRIDLRLENWNDYTGDTTELCGKYNITGNQRSWRLVVNTNTGCPTFSWSTDGTAITQYAGTVPLPVPGNGRLAVRATLDVNNGLGGYTVTFYTSDSISGTWTQLEQAVTTAGTTSIFNSTANVELGNLTSIDYATFNFQPAYGRLYAFQLLNGIGGSAVANPDFTAQAAGTTTFADAAGRTWTLTNAPIDDRIYRFVGEISTWPTRWDTGGFDIYVPVEGAGILRRLGQGSRPLQSTLRRRVPSYSPLAYWPMEDGSAATTAASPISGVSAMTTSGITFAQDASLAGASSLPTLNTTGPITLSGTVPPPSSSLTGWQIIFLYKITTGPATQRVFLRVKSTGTAVDWQIKQGTGGSNITALDFDGNVVVNTNIGTGTDIFGDWIALKLFTSVSGGTVTWNVAWEKLSGSFGSINGTFTGTLGHPTAIVSPDGGYSTDLSGMSIGHIGVFGTELTNAYEGAFSGYTGEYAGNRMLRLAREESIPVTVTGVITSEEQVGPQSQETFLSLLQESADADRGILYERRGVPSVGYRDRNTLVNQTAGLSLSYTNSALIAPLEPTDDDYLTHNKVIVSRTNGSSATEEDTTSSLSTQAPPNGVGVYDVEYSLNMYNDTRLDYIAGWILHLGTWNEERYPVIRLGLHSDTTLIPSASSVEIGDRIQITSPPSWLPPGTIDLMVIGYTEVFDQFTWFISYNCVPYGPWNIGIAEDATYSRADTEGSELTSSATSAATTMYVTTTSGPFWTTAGGDVPFDVTVSGEQVTATAITSSVLDTFTRTSSSSWGSPDVGGAWSNTGGSASDYSVGSGSGSHVHTAASTGHHSVITAIGADFDIYCDVAVAALSTGASQLMGPIARYTDVNNLYQARVDFTTTNAINLTIRSRVASVETALGTFTTMLTNTAGTFYRVRFQGIGSTLNAKIWNLSTPEASDWDITVTDTALTTAGSLGMKSVRNSGNTNANAQFLTDNFTVVNPQTFTVTRSVNGVVKAQSAGADVRLTHPTYVAL